MRLSTAPPTACGRPRYELSRSIGCAASSSRQPPFSDFRLRQVTLRLEYDRPVGLAQSIGDRADGTGVEQALDLAERADEAVVVADLGDETALLGQVGQPVRVGGREGERFLTEHVHTSRFSATLTVDSWERDGVAIRTASTAQSLSIDS